MKKKDFSHEHQREYRYKYFKIDFKKIAEFWKPKYDINQKDPAKPITIFDLNSITIYEVEKNFDQQFKKEK